MALPLPNFNLNDALNNNSSAVGGRISNGMIFNTSGSSVGFVKLLAIAAGGLLLYRFWRK